MPIDGQIPDPFVSSGNDGAQLGHVTATDDPRAGSPAPMGRQRVAAAATPSETTRMVMTTDRSHRSRSDSGTFLT